MLKAPDYPVMASVACPFRDWRRTAWDVPVRNQKMNLGENSE